ncbi:MAG: stage II sporulation protein M [Flammeovirgaceae bacterium]|nr:stage II sporulation protein M [Flammeovirgaceae bacterium]
MKETDFINQNKDKWQDFEKVLNAEIKNPEKLSEVFVQITDDLSYARTFYPNRSVRFYLNNLAQKVFYNIYKNKKEKKSKLISFWVDELPSIIFHCKKELLISLIVFTLAMGIGVLSSAHDPEFCRSILGDDYVDMTIANIEKGDPMAVYKQRNELDMFLGITLNNILVAFRTFVSGLVFAIGSIGILLFNGIMVGSFQYFFIEKGLFLESFLTIWLHGTLEISSIVIAGGGGIVMGSGLVFPGTYSRMQAFQITAKKGLKILIGIAPILALAGFIEGFFTRYTDAPDFIRFAVILVSFAFIVGYFIYYPFLLYKKGRIIPEKVEEEVSQNSYTLSSLQNEIRANSGIITDVLLLFKRNIRAILKWSFIVAIGYTFCFELINKIAAIDYFADNNLFAAIIEIFDYDMLRFGVLPKLVLNTLMISIGIAFVFGILNKKIVHKDQKINLVSFLIEHSYKFLIAGILVNLIIFLGMELINSLYFFGFLFFIVIYISVIPIPFLWVFVGIKENNGLLKDQSNTIAIIKGNYSRLLGLSIILTFISALFLILIGTPFLISYFEFVNYNFLSEGEGSSVPKYINMTLAIFATNIVITFSAFGNSLIYFSFLEINQATGLKDKINQLFI